jgi:hypothetical protein
MLGFRSAFSVNVFFFFFFFFLFFFFQDKNINKLPKIQNTYKIFKTIFIFMSHQNIFF